ncbi:PQQ-like beta-propeller repeat protein [Catellatospora tritici]|uniref:PQQ-like beta-propeller repeat protein n=1 Tax=Catellatospora tritici TaxID=2851566 RepID=UPI001C2D9BB8|nr:PQQ-like beta-propeller repeat protein [Catellatospora tritici]MBV1851523.1 PQQ-like beta-propeller repeat protein [Catellatospora tritici]
MTGEIELGSGWTHPHDPEPAPLWHPERFAGWLRPGALVLVGLLALACGAAAAPVEPVAALASLRVVPAGDDALAVVGDSLLVAERGALAAFDLRDGTLRWSAARQDHGEQITLEVPSGLGVVLLRENDPAGDAPRITAYEIATGRQVWHRATRMLVTGGLGYAYALVLPFYLEPFQREVIDLATGAVRWSAPEDVVRGVSDDPDPLLWTADADGRVRAYRLADGTLVRSGYVPRLRDVPTGLIIEQGRLTPVTSDWETGENRYDVVSYDTTTFAAVPTVPELIDSRPCASLRCVSRPADGSLVAQVRDPRTGALQYEVPRRELRETSAGFLVLALGTTRFGSAAEALIDPVTGQTRQILTGWEVAALDTSGTLLRESGDHVQIGRLDADGAVRVLAELPPRVRRCQYLSGVLACHDVDDRIALWRLTG